MSKESGQLTLPWQPLFTIERSCRPEVTVYGIISLVSESVASTDGNHEQVQEQEQKLVQKQGLHLVEDPLGKELLSRGDVNYQVWSRSLLKPWQLLNHIHILKKNYPALTDEHFALFMASHSAEPGHMKLLDEIKAITGVDENLLKCPPAVPLSRETKESIKEKGLEGKARRYHNCSGKHMGYLAAIAAEGGDSAAYLVESEKQHTRLKKILAELTGRPEASFLHTTDGCQLPNYGLSPRELASLYRGLLVSPPSLKDDLIKDCSPYYAELGQLMSRYPRTISGGNRLDYKLMSENLLGRKDLRIIAKEGADGLLGLGIAPCRAAYNNLKTDFKGGLGLCIKLSSGFDNRYMELICREIFERLGLIEKQEVQSAPHIKTVFHFDLDSSI